MAHTIGHCVITSSRRSQDALPRAGWALQPGSALQPGRARHPLRPRITFRARRPSRNLTHLEVPPQQRVSLEFARTDRPARKLVPGDRASLQLRRPRRSLSATRGRHTPHLRATRTAPTTQPPSTPSDGESAEPSWCSPDRIAEAPSAPRWSAHAIPGRVRWRVRVVKTDPRAETRTQPWTANELG